MALNRDKFRKIVGGITTATEPEQAPDDVSPSPAVEVAKPEPPTPPAGQGGVSADANGPADQETTGESRRFAKRGRPKGRKEDEPTGKTRKVKVSLFLSEVLVNDLYDWAHADRIHPGEMFERALKPFHEKEAKRRNAGKG
jgi:hypothetical protein